MPITKKNDAKSKKYWELAQEVRKAVEEWPTWKQEIRLSSCPDETKHPANKTTRDSQDD